MTSIIIALTALLIGGFLYLNRPQLVTFPGSVPPNFPADGFSHSVFESLLQRYGQSRRTSNRPEYDLSLVSERLRQRPSAPRLPSERGVIDYIVAEASAELLASLERSIGYEFIFGDYDWALTAQEIDRLRLTGRRERRKRQDGDQDP